MDLKSATPVVQIQSMYEATDMVPINIHATNQNNEAIRLFAVANHKNSTGGYESNVVILRYNETSQQFSIHQTIPEYAPYEVEAFKGAITPMHNKHFLAVAGTFFCVAFLLAHRYVVLRRILVS